MPSVSPERGRPRSRQQGSSYAKASPSRTRSPPRRTISPRSASRSRSRTLTPNARGDRRNGFKEQRPRSRSPRRSVTRSKSPAYSERNYRDRSYSRTASRSPPPAPISSKIVIERLTKNVNENHLHEIFGSYGQIKDLELSMNRQFNINRGTAYIVYAETADAEAAIAHMHEAQLDGAIINVSIVLPKRKFSRSPPPSRTGPPQHDRFEPRGPPTGGYRGGPPPPGYGPPGGGRYRSPPQPRRASPPPPARRYGRRPSPRDRNYNSYRPRSYSRSRSPRRRRSPSYSSRSRSRSPPRRKGTYNRRDSPPHPPSGGRRRRSPSYSSYSSYSDRSRSRSRGRYGRGR